MENKTNDFLEIMENNLKKLLMTEVTEEQNEIIFNMCAEVESMKRPV
jgi:hypothetical protein